MDFCFYLFSLLLGRFLLDLRGRNSMLMRLPWWFSGKESACNAGDSSLIPGLGRSPGGGNDNPLQYSCLGNPEEPEGLQSMGLQRVSHDLATKQQQQLLSYYPATNSTSCLMASQNPINQVAYNDSLLSNVISMPLPHTPFYYPKL